MAKCFNHSSRLTICLGVALAVTVGPDFLLANETMPHDNRLILIRGLAHEIAVTKMALPRGKHGVYLDSKGQLDQAKARQEFRLNGVGISPGMPSEITKITFKSTELIFEINGGGKSGRKWYQRIEVGMGTATAPVAPQNPVSANGSYVTVRFPGKVPDLNVPQVKQILANVLDFERHSPTVLYSPSVPPKIKEAIKKHEVIVGMDRDAVLSAKGAPDRKVREERNGVEHEDWIYGLPPHVLLVTFDGDNVVGVQQY